MIILAVLLLDGRENVAEVSCGYLRSGAVAIALQGNPRAVRRVVATHGSVVAAGVVWGGVIAHANVVAKLRALAGNHGDIVYEVGYVGLGVEGPHAGTLVIDVVELCGEVTTESLGLLASEPCDIKDTLHLCLCLGIGVTGRAEQ